MPKLRPGQNPSLRRHPAAKQGVVRLSGHDHYLGAWHTHLKQPPRPVRDEYDRLIALWVAGGRRPLAASADGPTVNELIVAYVEHTQTYYRRADGTQTTEVKNVRLALRPLRALFGDTAAADFDGPALEAVRDRMAADGRCRGRVNKDVGRIRRMFKWSAAKGRAPLATYQLLQTVEGWRAGRSPARETAPVTPVDDLTVELTVPFLTAPLRAMVRLQGLTGMRPGEVCGMTAESIERTPDLWYYRPAQHKTAHHGRRRVVPLGPRARALLAPFLDGAGGHLFSPSRAVAQSRVERRSRRKTPVYPSEGNQRKARPKRQPGDRYAAATYAGRVALAARKAAAARLASHRPDLSPPVAAASAAWAAAEAAYRRAAVADRPRLLGLRRDAERAFRAALADACGTAGWPDSWHPNQIRHARGTELRQLYGLEGAQVVLGHARADVTQIYAERDLALAERIAREVG
jgi:integrase